MVLAQVAYDNQSTLVRSGNQVELPADRVLQRNNYF